MSLLLAPAEAVPDFASLTLLALIQGLTEFLPISSSGHLVLAQAALGFEAPALTADVALHVGTLVAVLVVYRRDVLALLSGIPRGELGEPALVVLGTLPAAAVGLVFRSELERAFDQPRWAAGGLFVTALVLLAGEWGRRRSRPDEESFRWWHALGIGLAQALAIWPGISRSGTTIAAGMLCGLSPARAARFSFLLAIPAILGAALLQAPALAGQSGADGLGRLLWGAAFAGFVGWGALRVLLAFLGRGAFTWFAAYCVALGTGALVFA